MVVEGEEGGEEIDPGKDTSETVISPFIKFYGRLTHHRSPLVFPRV